jgi:hypothetical protein
MVASIPKIPKVAPIEAFRRATGSNISEADWEKLKSLHPNIEKRISEILLNRDRPLSAAEFFVPRYNSAQSRLHRIFIIESITAILIAAILSVMVEGYTRPLIIFFAIALYLYLRYWDDFRANNNKYKMMSEETRGTHHAVDD